MTKLSDTQAIILSAAQRPDGNLLPLPGSLRGGAASKVVGALLARGLAQEQATYSMQKADAALNRFWRNDDDGRGVLLLITPNGLDAIGVERESKPRDAERDQSGFGGTSEEPASGRTRSVEGDPATEAGPEPARASAPRVARSATRVGTKQAELVAMLRRKEGATIAEVVAATGWQPHTVRGAFARGR